MGILPYAVRKPIQNIPRRISRNVAWRIASGTPSLLPVDALCPDLMFLYPLACSLFKMQMWLQEYVKAQHAAFDSIPMESVAGIVRLLSEAHREDRQIFVFGNGGSAANASHFVTDLGKGASDKLGKRFRCMSLNDNVSWMTAIGNDYAYEDIFWRQLQNFAKPGDIAMALSVSGNSPNVVRALDWAKENGLKTIALVGGKRGKAAEIAQRVIVIDSIHYGRVEDAQMLICHMLCYIFIENGL